MNQCGKVIDGTLIANDQSSEVLNPGVGPLHDPAMPVAPQTAAVLVGGLPVIATGRNDRLDAPPGQTLTDGVAVIPFIGHQALGALPGTPSPMGAAHMERFQNGREKLRFRRGRRVHVKSERSTRAINQYHKLRSLPALCFAHFEPPFFAEAKVPSTKHSFHWMWSRSCSWARKARHTFSNVPSRAHFCNRRCTVLEGPYRLGNSLQGAPVQRTHRIPSKQHRSSSGGRPPLRSFLRQGLFRAGSCSLTFSHCRSVSFLQAMQNAPRLGADTRLGYHKNYPALRGAVLG